MPLSPYQLASWTNALLRSSLPSRYPLDRGGRSYGRSVCSPTGPTRLANPPGRTVGQRVDELPPGVLLLTVAALGAAAAHHVPQRDALQERAPRPRRPRHDQICRVAPQRPATVRRTGGVHRRGHEPSSEDTRE